MSEHRKTRGRWINGAQCSCVDEGQPEGMVYCSILLLRFHYHVAVNLQCIFASLVISNIDRKTSSLSPNRSYSSKNSTALALFGQ